jgi:hypothetical protein
VAFEKNIRTDDAESLIEAIKHLRGVLAVEPKVADSMSWISDERARRELGQKLWEVLYPKEKERT